MMDESGLDALLVASPHNLCYVAGVQLVIPQNLIHRFHFAVIPRSSEPVFIVSEPEMWLVQEDTWIEDVRPYGSLLRPWSTGEQDLETTPSEGVQTTPMEQLLHVFDEKSLLDARVGIETTWLPVYYYEKLREFLPKTTFASCSSLLKQLQQVRTADEVDLLRHANYSMAKALHLAFESSHVGDTEISVAANIVYHLVNEGLEPRTFTMGSGPIRGRRGHPWPGKKRLNWGDLIHADPKGSYKGYHGDVVRMAIVGQPTTEQARTYEKLRSIHFATIDACRPGMTAHDLYHFCEGAFEREGLKMHMSLIGHGVGCDLGHDPHIGDITIMSGVDTPLLPGMVFTVEPIYDTDDGRWHMEDALLMTEDGVEILSNYPRGGQYLYVIGE